MLTFESFKTEKPILMREAAGDKVFDQIISDTLTSEEIKVKGNYGSLAKKSHIVKIDKRDKVAYDKLYFKYPDKITGNGEIAIYWLYNYKGGKNNGKAKSTQGGSQPDLLINGKNAEVKAYPHKAGGEMSLGRYERRKDFRSLASTLFGIHNLRSAFQGGSGRGQQTFKGELSFDYRDLEQAAESYLELKELIEREKQLQEFKVFRDMGKTIKDFDKLLKGIGHKGDSAADYGYSLMKTLMAETLAEKPGDDGYIVNTPYKGKNVDENLYFYYINFKNMSNDPKALAGIKAGGGQLKAKFALLFPGDIR